MLPCFPSSSRCSYACLDLSQAPCAKTCALKSKRWVGPAGGGASQQRHASIGCGPLAPGPGHPHVRAGVRARAGCVIVVCLHRGMGLGGGRGVVKHELASMHEQLLWTAAGAACIKARLYTSPRMISWLVAQACNVCKPALALPVQGRRCLAARTCVLCCCSPAPHP